jgi:hypothetical protein
MAVSVAALSASPPPPPLPPRTHLPALRFPWGVVLLSLLAYPVSWLLSLTAAMDDARLVLLAGIVCCTAIAPLAYLLVVRGVPAGRDVYFYVFTIFAFTSMVDLLLALTIDGHTHVLRFYLAEGERYLSTAHGLWINAWDGTFHYTCYLLLTSMLLRARHSYSDTRFRFVGLLWSGSILNSMIVLFVGSAVGNHAHHIKPSYLLNIPYALFPSIFLYRILQARPDAASVGTAVVTTAAPKAQRKPRWHWLLDVPLMALTFACMSLCVIRALSVLRSTLPLAELYSTPSWGEAHLHDESAYPVLQMLIYAFYLLPYFVWAMVRLGNPWMTNGDAAAEASEASAASSFRDWTVVALGAVLQGGFSYVGAALHQGSAYESRLWRGQNMKDIHPFLVFVAANALMVLTPLLILLRIHLVRSTAQTATATTDKRTKTQ